MILSFTDAINGIMGFLPKFIAGSIILILGIIISSVVRRIIGEIAKTIKLENTLKKYGVPEIREDFTWTNILAEIIRWFVIIIFLIPTADIWGLRQIVNVLDTFLFYLPNVFVAAMLTLIGFIFAKLAYDIVLASIKGVSPESSYVIASVTRWAIIIFVILAVLNQLGVASDLIRILFTGFVAMIAIAGGIAFGLGGKEAAKEILERIIKKI